MSIHLKNKIIAPRHKKDGRINPHRFWIFLISSFIFVLTVNVIYFTYFFVIFSRKLDDPVVPKLDTNSGQIRKIEESIKKTEDAIFSRTKGDIIKN